MTNRRREANSRWLGLFLAALTAVLITVLGAGTPSGASVSAAQTRVGAHTLMAQVVVGPDGGIGAGQRLGNDLPAYDFALATGVAANSGSRIAANQAAGNAFRDSLAAAHPGSLIEQSFSTTASARRMDILTQSGLAIESKVGRTSLTSAARSQVAKDSLLLRNGDVSGVQWVFSRSGVTGEIGPTGPLGTALDKAGIPWMLAP